MLRLLRLCLMALSLCALVACHYERDDDAWAAMDTEAEVDSVDFRAAHHYWKGYNFAATDSFTLAVRPPFAPELSYGEDTELLIVKRDVVAVEDIRKDTTQRPAVIWLKVATLSRQPLHGPQDVQPQALSGWIAESRMMRHVVPDTPVSKVIHRLGAPSTKWLLGAGAVLLWGGLVGLRLRRRFEAVGAQSLYPVLLNLLVSGMVVLHRSIWHFVPDTWVEYYFYPSLNPFSQEMPPIIALFVLGMWLLLLVGIAMLDDLRRKTGGGMSQFLLTLLVLAFRTVALFAAFAVLCPFWLLYPLLIGYWYIILHRYVRYYRRHTTYRCGNCGKAIAHLGPCPYCGAINR